MSSPRHSDVGSAHTAKQRGVSTEDRGTPPKRATRSGATMADLLVVCLAACLLRCEGRLLPASIGDFLSGRGAQVQYDEVSRYPEWPRYVPGWPQEPPPMGEVSGVSVNAAGQPVVFHRGPRVWDASSFNATAHFQHVPEGPIAVDTVLVLDPLDGSLLESWGREMFYMPHGITVGPRGDIWLTDVALHQVFKFEPGGNTPTLVFGERLEPGAGSRRLCQPTSVAEASTGDVFIADGYCNSRILMFDRHGVLLRVLPEPPEFLPLNVPHSLALLENLDLLCIADRENMRVVCPRADLNHRRGREPPAITMQDPSLGRVFAVAAYGNFVYAVNGPTSPMIAVRGFTMDPQEEAIIDHWPLHGQIGRLENPHAMAISPNGSAIYITEMEPNRFMKFSLKRH